MSMHRVIAVFGHHDKVDPWVTDARAFVAAVGANAGVFANPSPPLATVTAAIDAVATAQAETKKSHGMIPAREKKWEDGRILVGELVGYVQTVADRAGPDAASVISLATLHPKKAAVQGKHVFHVEQMDESGAAHVFAEVAGRRAAYDWQTTLDGGKTFIDHPGTLQANTVIRNLPPGANVGFRYRPRTAAGQGEWSPIIYLIVK